MARGANADAPPIVVLFGEDDYARARRLGELLDALLPEGVDRSLAVSEYDGAEPEDRGGPSAAAVFDDLATRPFLAPRRVVIIRDADVFVSATRERLERYLEHPSPSGTLVLECRSFPKTTRLYKRAVAAGGWVEEFRKPTGRTLRERIAVAAERRGKQIDPTATDRLLQRVGEDPALVEQEIEKLSLYVGSRPTITIDDVDALVGLTREERIFAVLEAAGCGQLETALRQWLGMLTTDPATPYRAVGGMAFVLRRWLTAQRLAADGLPVHTIAGKVMMWRRERELAQILRRNPPRRVRRLLAALAEADLQAKQGRRSIETVVEALILATAGMR